MTRPALCHSLLEHMRKLTEPFIKPGQLVLVFDEIEIGFSIEEEAFNYNNSGLLAEQIQALEPLVFHLQFKMMQTHILINPP